MAGQVTKSPQSDELRGDHGSTSSVAADSSEARPIVERVGLALIAFVLTGVFGALAAVAISGGEVFLAVMSGTGALMTLWAALGTIRRG